MKAEIILYRPKCLSYDVFGVILEILGLKGHGRNLENGIGMIGPNGPAGLSHVSDKRAHSWILNHGGYYRKLGREDM